MSGGHYEYAYSKIQELADTLEVCLKRFGNDGRPLKSLVKDPKRVKFKRLLVCVAEAAKAIEWVDSGDCSPGDEHEAIDRVFSQAKKMTEE